MSLWIESDAAQVVTPNLAELKFIFVFLRIRERRGSISRGSLWGGVVFRWGCFKASPKPPKQNISSIGEVWRFGKGRRFAFRSFSSLCTGCSVAASRGALWQLTGCFVAASRGALCGSSPGAQSNSISNSKLPPITHLPPITRPRQNTTHACARAHRGETGRRERRRTMHTYMLGLPVGLLT